MLIINRFYQVVVQGEGEGLAFTDPEQTYIKRG